MDDEVQEYPNKRMNAYYYGFNPTGVERTDTQKVLDGDLGEFVEASLKAGLSAGSKRLDATA